MTPHSGCAWSPEERYAILVKWEDFYSNPEKYINEAFEKRSDPIANKIKIYITYDSAQNFTEILCLDFINNKYLI